MITPDEIRAKALRHYPLFLREWLEGAPFEPLHIAVGALPTEYTALRTAVTKLLNGATTNGAGYTVKLQTRQTRAHGSQSLPTQVLIETPDDLLALCGKRHEFARFRADVGLIRAGLPQLEPWVVENALLVIKEHGAWPELLRVCAYFLEQPRPHLYIRELPIEVHTKFIETHTGVLRRLLDFLLPQHIAAEEKQFERRYGLRYDEPVARLRFLDPALQARAGSPVADLGAPVSQLAALGLEATRCVLVENKMTFLTLPALPDTVALFGGGFAAETLAELPWLHGCEIWYWGDLDAQGFQILSRFRSLLPHTHSLMMDSATFEAFRMFAVGGTVCNATALPHLSDQEHAMFVYLAQNNTRLEQERIQQDYVVQYLWQRIVS